VSRRQSKTGSVTQLSPRRILVFLRRTTKVDRVVIAFLLFSLVLRSISSFVRPLPYLAFLSILSLVAAVYLCGRLLSWARTRLLWGLRNRLIVAYIFMAVVPVVLLLSMMSIGMYLLYPQIGAHLLQDELQNRIGIITADADEIASAVVQDIQNGEPPTDPSLLAQPGVANLIAAAQEHWPGLSVFLHRGRLVSPAGGGFAGLAEYQGLLMFASEQRRDTPGGPISVLVGAPIGSSLLDAMSSDLGPIQLTLLQPAEPKARGITLGINGRLYVPGERIVSSNRSLPPRANWLDIPVSGAATLEAYQIESDPDKYPATLPEPAPVLATFSLRPSTLNRSLLSSVGAVGPILLAIVIVAGVVFLIIEIVALVTGIVLTRTITRSVGDLYEATLHVARGDFAHRVRVHQRDQLGALGESFNEMTGSITTLIEGQRQRQRLEHEVAIASEVQQQLFPKIFPSLPGLHLGAICRPARVVSGDYYDFIRIGSTSVGIALADISGKGIFAALLMASLQAALRSTATLDGNGNTAKLVSLLNAHLFKNTSDDRYATFFYATYDCETHTLTYTNAGHLAPLLITDGCVQQLEQGGTVVGLFENPPYTQVTMRVASGALLVAFSDGLTEAANVHGEEFGISRLRKEIARHRDMPVEQLAENLVAAAEHWAGTPEQADDITVVVARID
jgi:sigma-B regulation protein RsbU (phosphoserine phosphatase)